MPDWHRDALCKEHPEVEMSAFVIPQVSGSIKRSHSVDGVAESLVKSKKYLLPLVVLSPVVTGTRAVRSSALVAASICRRASYASRWRWVQLPGKSNG